jgi:hypothetical protein
MAGGAELAVYVGVGVGRLALQEKQRGGERKQPEISHK